MDYRFELSHVVVATSTELEVKLSMDSSVVVSMGSVDEVSRYFGGGDDGELVT